METLMEGKSKLFYLAEEDLFLSLLCSFGNWYNRSGRAELHRRSSNFSNSSESQAEMFAHEWHGFIPPCHMKVLEMCPILAFLAILLTTPVLLIRILSRVDLRSTGFSEVIVVVGGCERVGGFNLPYTECYDPVTGEWTSLAKHPEYTKSEYAVCALRNDILVSGGRINSSYVWMYNSQLNVWIRVASLNKGRWRHKMTVLLGKVYAVGGYDGQCCLSNVEVYDSFSNRWTEVAPMKEAVYSPAVTSCAGKLFVIGGQPDENGCSNKVQCYDPETDSWQLRACIPFTKPNISAVSLNNVIYVCGGLTKSIYCYDPSQDHWMHVGHSFSRQESCGISICNGKIYILGGRGEHGDASDNIVCYDPASGIITSTAAMPRPISYHGCVTIHRFSEKQRKA
ncbi:kelch-like protein 24a isoform X2 [Rhinichthys klamathensis goyatoka]|uniref:kelch-like protein 24a isoform X2 n=1 Tax=Rhinichthys klamathensis goyatoka TaxID=3034132 RepID=UPI0024B4E2D6|nr:kelch-like protein 24a isoform X2 [Rhinichthys klamathensis goyatoka]